MSKNITELREKLSKYISKAAAKEKIPRYIRAATATLMDHYVNGQLVVRFVDKCLLQIEIRLVVSGTSQATNLHYRYKVPADTKNVLRASAHQHHLKCSRIVKPT